MILIRLLLNVCKILRNLEEAQEEAAVARKK